MSTDHDDDMSLVTTKKAKKRKTEKNDWSIQDPQTELDLIEWYKDNTYLWLITDKEYTNYARKNSALEDKGKELGITAEHINGWWKSNRDTYTKLSKRKSGEELTDLPYKQRWILEKFAFLKQRPTTVKAPVVSIASLAQQHHDLEAVETVAAIDGYSQLAASSSGHKAKSRSEEADFQEALLRSLYESREGAIAGMMQSTSTAEDDYLTQWGRTMVAAMRRMSKRRERAFRKDVEELLHRYSPTSSEDESFPPPRRKTVPSETAVPCTLQMSSYGDSLQPDPNSSESQNPPQASVYNSSDNPEYTRQYLSRHNQPTRPQMTRVHQPPRCSSTPSSAGSGAEPSRNIKSEAAANTNITHNSDGYSAVTLPQSSASDFNISFVVDQDNGAPTTQ